MFSILKQCVPQKWRNKNFKTVPPLSNVNSHVLQYYTLQQYGKGIQIGASERDNNCLAPTSFSKHMIANLELGARLRTYEYAA